MYAKLSHSGAQEKSKIRIAVADDHPVFRDGLCRLLALEHDLEVVAEAGDGVQALDAISRLEPDILLLDLNMPPLGGLATLERMQTAPGKPRTIILTASDSRQDLLRALKLGSCGIILKQTATERLIAAIRQVHAGELSVDSSATATLFRDDKAHEPEPPAPPPAQRDQAQRLSPRERQLVALVSQGLKNAGIAEELKISEQTVKNHLHNIFDKLGVSDRLQLALYAVHTSPVSPLRAG